MDSGGKFYEEGGSRVGSRGSEEELREDEVGDGERLGERREWDPGAQALKGLSFMAEAAVGVDGSSGICLDVGHGMYWRQRRRRLESISAGSSDIYRRRKMR